MGSDEKPCRRMASGTRDQREQSGIEAVKDLRLSGDLIAARKLRDAFLGLSGGGVFGEAGRMPEEEYSRGIAGERDRLLFITLVVGIDYQRDAVSLWRHGRERYDDPATRWLFRPEVVASRSVDEVLLALRTGDPRGALRYPSKDAGWWHLNASTLAREFEGDPRVLFGQAGWNVEEIRRQVRRSGRFSGLKGAKIFPLWLRMLADILGYAFEDFDTLSIPVDIHIARATFATGILGGRYDGPLGGSLIALVRHAWKTACEGAGERVMTFDEPLWQLSRLGCTHRHRAGHPDCPKRETCPIGDLCPPGRIEVSTAGVRIDT